MKQLLLLITFYCLLFNAAGLHAQNNIPPASMQIKAALTIAPEHFKAGAKVYGYTQQGEWTVLRQGSNKLICIADDPAKKRFHVVCYYKALEPFMKRGRELRRKGYSEAKVNKIRRQEIKSGELSFPDRPMALYNLFGPPGAFDYETGTLIKATPLYVIYVPFSTRKSTGIATKPPAPGAPWLMEAGLPESHIMIPGEPIGTAVEKD